MKLSESTGELFSALAEFQDECPEIIKDKTVEVKKNGKFLYEFDYASLGNMIETVTPTLSKHGLSVTQSVGNSGVITMIGHKSGQWLITEPLQVDFDGDEQSQGSSITYKRRYQFGGALNLDSIKDDDANNTDGNEANFKNNKPSPKKKQSAPKKKKETPKKEEKKADVDLSDATNPTEVLTALWDETDDANEVRERLLKWYKSQDGDDQAKFKNEIMERLQKQPEGLQPDFEV